MLNFSLNLVVRLLLAALIEVMISINAKMPRAIMATVIAVRNLLPEILVQESASVSLKVMCSKLNIQPKVKDCVQFKCKTFTNGIVDLEIKPVCE